MAYDTEYTVQQILNRVFDGTNALRGSSSASTAGRPVQLSAQAIFNRSFDEDAILLRING